MIATHSRLPCRLHCIMAYLHKVQPVLSFFWSVAQPFSSPCEIRGGEGLKGCVSFTMRLRAVSGPAPSTLTCQRSVTVDVTVLEGKTETDSLGRNDVCVFSECEHFQF